MRYNFVPLSNKLNIIKRIKRLSFMPLPVSRYVDLIFDLVGVAILNSNVKVMILNKFGTKFIWKDIDFSKFGPLYNRCFGMTFEECGVLSYTDVVLFNKTVLTFEEVRHPNFNNSYIYNELYKPVGIYSFLLTILRIKGECVGEFPLFRAKDMPPFTKEDVLFMESIAPYIAYGISKSERVCESFNCCLDSDKPIVRLQESDIGLLLINAKGEIDSMNDAAKNMFFQIGLLDNLGYESIEEKQLRELIRYVNTVTRNVFLNEGYNCNALPSKIYTSSSGISIMMKGYRLEGTCSESSLVAITCEEVLPDDFMKLKRRMRYNLSEKEFEICRLLKEGYSTSEIEKILNITKNTFKTHKANILNKICLDDMKEIKIFLRKM